MAVEERRRIALHRAAAASWGEEVADTLVELVTPSGHEVATRQDIEEVLAVMNRRFESVEQRFESIDERFESVDQRFESIEQRFGAVDRRFASMEQSLAERLEAMEHRITAAFERRIADAVSLQTRTLVLSQLGALVVISALAFGLR